ncbi:hypothetical protein [Ligilactobacillus animalis]|uniref:hypothetical protein n=1 Tax=Ligilactobacillus animalis TaxID=1605 RepID=UPI0026E11098|nr:hypothetical protein [Ligilactobacillus animalis]MDO5882566.1 hypothetical protein [Ligilactobacillus animalis]MDO5883886.1 hypothetical protein [Ligilactobacillus animalis]
MTRFDVINAIKAHNDPNSCYQPSDDDNQLYTVRIHKDTLLDGQTIYDIVDLTQERIGEHKKVLENMLKETKKELAKVEYEELTLKSEYDTETILKIAGNYFPDDAIEEE